MWLKLHNGQHGYFAVVGEIGVPIFRIWVCQSWISDSESRLDFFHTATANLKQVSPQSPPYVT